MKIRAKLRFGPILTAATVFVLMGTMVYYAAEIRVADAKQKIAEKIAETSFQSALLLSEYVRHPSERPKAQWINIYLVRANLLDENAFRFTVEEEKVLFEEVRQASVSGRELFEELVRTVESGGNETLIQELYNQLIVKVQTRISNSLRLAEMSRQRSRSAGAAFGLSLFAMIWLIVGISVASYLISARIARSFQKLGENTRAIAKGDFSGRMEIESKDEIGDVARLFNNMAEELRASRGALEQRVKERTKELSTILGALDNVALVSMTDAKGDIVYANDRFVEVSKYSREELLGQNHRILKSGQQPDSLFTGLWNTISHGKVWRGEIMNKAKDGTHYWDDTSIAPVLDDRGKPVRYISVRFLITERKRSDLAKTEFVSLMSHQLRTPLTDIRWSLSSLSKEEGISPKHRGKIRESYESAVRLIKIIGSMLTISQLESGQMRYHPTRVNVLEFLRGLENDYLPLCKIQSLNLRVTCPHDLYFETDEPLAREALSNLLSNAVRYTPKDGSIEITATGDAKNISINVSDTGFGILDEDRNRIFTKFFRGANVVDKVTEGSGLGLHLVNALMTLLGGDVSYAPLKDSGTRFTLHFPLLAPHAKKDRSHPGRGRQHDAGGIDAESPSRT